MKSSKLVLLSVVLICFGCSTKTKKSSIITDNKVVQLETSIKLPPSQVWQIVTEEKHLAKWWNDGVRIEPKNNGDFYEPWRDREGHSQLATGKVLAFEKQKFIRFTWREKTWKENQNTICQIDIVPQEGQSLVKVTHSNWSVFSSKESKALRKGFAIGWNRLLKSLEAYSKKVLQ